MNALRFIVDTLLSLVFFVFLLRLLLQLSRADFRNPLAQAVLKLTNWLVMPLRRLFPPAGRIDTASVIAVLLIAIAHVGLLHLVQGFAPPNAIAWVSLAAMTIVRNVLRFYLYGIFLYALISLIAPGVHSPVQSLLAALFEPILRPIRRVIPPIGGLDLSPLWACIALQALLLLL